MKQGVVRGGSSGMASDRLHSTFSCGRWTNFVRLGALVLTLGGAMVHAARFKVVETLEIGRVVSDFRVGFSLVTDEGSNSQYVAYYDDQRRMTVAMRSLDSSEWHYQTLPSKVGWDSHNYITMAIDRLGNLHVAGNMHADPLVYFVTSRPGDISSLKPGAMTGEREERVTYPRFMNDHEGKLVFNYRDGGSGRGARLFNRFDPETKSWARLLDTPLLDGEGQRNAYPLGPVRGPDGWFHMVWVWRMTPDCATNHHLSHARSRDLIAWESSGGRKVELPITFEDDFLLIDPIPVGGGIINGGAKLFFDKKKRPLVTYHKSDAEGNMQMYVARPEGKGWKIQQLTEWNDPIEFSGNGSMNFIGIRASEAMEAEPGVLTLSYQHRVLGSGRLFFDEESLRPLEGPFEVTKALPSQLGEVESDFPGMQIRRATDQAGSDAQGVRYVLQWESLGAHQDKRRKPPYPEPSMLRLYRLVE
ncbi:BNR repeat-containing protein [Haloferula rosea]|uniref:BNR repeat-containing protein n=1 Tax=Haloferula rosea TaxID=490093 RepID=A0A934RF89_9BACT|nr:BNR repeat-containing protein [Haloferula rosea]MBK1828056.1 BNR repeat-containing protein [Haloferula rosea]